MKLVNFREILARGGVSNRLNAFPLLQISAFCFLASLLSGCAAYKLGPTNGLQAQSRSVQVRPFQNQTMEPRVIEPLDTALRRLIQQDGTYRLETRDKPDVILTGSIVEYRRSALSFDPTDILTPRDFSIAMSAQVTAVEISTGKELFNRTVSGRTTVRAGPDFHSAEREAAPLLAEDLARNITSLLVDGDW